MRIPAQYGKHNGYEIKDVFTRWYRYSAYEITEITNPIPPQKRGQWERIVPPLETIKVIRPAPGATNEQYDPLEKGTAMVLLTEFSKLHSLNKKEILRFCRGFGHLGMLCLYPELDEFFDAETGEPLTFTLERSRKVARLLEIYRAFSEKDFLILKTLIKPLYFSGNFYDFAIDEEKKGPFLNSDGTWGEGQEFTWAFDGNPPYNSVTEKGYYHAAAWYLAKTVNKELKGRVIEGVSVGNMKSDFKLLPGVGLDSLYACVYWQFRKLITGMDGLKKCIYCGSYFVPNNERQKACPPILKESKSPCRNRAAVATFAKSHPTKKKRKMNPS